MELSFQELKPSIDQHKVFTAQEDVNDIFCKFCQTKDDKPFLQFDDKCIQEKVELMKILAKHNKKEGLSSMVKYAHSEVSMRKINPNLMQSALGVILTHSKEAQMLGVVVPPLALYAQFKIKKKVYPSPVIPDILHGPEVLKYFREDYDLNQHHLYWHNVYPASGNPDDSCVLHRTITRQGELFLYMHSQMLARYNAELLAWNMELTHPFDYDEVPLHGYVPPPGLKNQYSSRPAGQGWFEDHNPFNTNNPPKKSDLLKWRNNIAKAILDGCITTSDGGTYPLTEDEEMNTIGVMVEALHEDIQEIPTGLFPDRDVYGNLHNQGHNKFAEIGLTETDKIFGVMGDVAAAIRDYIFWIWHRHIDNFRREIVRKYQHRLDQYRPEVEIVDLELVPRQEGSKTPPGGIATYLGPPNPELNEVNAKLGHEPYQWKVTVKSTRDDKPSESNPQAFTVRLFIVPGILFQDHNAWIEMDKFTYSLQQEQATIIRNDTESSVAAQVDTYSSSSRCSCGWPQNMMLPVGKPDGMPYKAFAILTNDELGENDYTTSLSFCGAKDGDYPDPRGMGYPFDKTWCERVDSTTSLETIIDSYSHTKLISFTIHRVKPPSDEPPENDTISAFNRWMGVLKHLPV